MVTPVLGITAEPVRPDLLGLAEALDQCTALNIAFVELSTYDMDLVVGGRVRRDQLARVKRVLSSRPLQWSVHGPLAINFFDELRIARHKQVLLASLEVAAELGARNYVLHAGLLYDDATPEAIQDAMMRQHEHLVWACDQARQAGLVICMENVFTGSRGRAFTPTPSMLAAQIKSINNPNLRATLDFSHAYQQSTHLGLDYFTECVALAPFAEHLHLHDSFGLRDDIWMYTRGEALAFGHGDLHLPIGWGDIAWDGLMAQCRFPATCWANIELDHRYWHERDACVSAARNVIASIRQQ